jgi:hypothetical protein
LKLKTGEIAVIYDFLFVICAGWNGKIIVKWILGKQSFMVWIGFIWPRIGTGAGPLVNMVMNLKVW